MRIPTTLTLVPVHGGSVRLGQEGVNFVSLRIEADGVRSSSGADRFDKLHRLRIHDINYARVSGCHIKMVQFFIKKDDIRGAAQRQVGKNLARACIEGDQSLCITSAKKPVILEVESQSVRTISRNCSI
jgi:hypothetical protein